MRYPAILMFALFCAPLARGAEADPPKDLDSLRQRIEDVVKKSDVPAIGVALVNREGPYWVAGWGMADRKSRRAANEDTLFRIGSISKMFAALSILKLQEEGKLSLNDRVRDRAPEIQFENPWEETHPVRIAHLLEHTTGWDDMHLVEYAYPAADSMTTREGLAVHPHSRTSRWMPGTRHAYCNSGSAVAAYIVEKLTGQRFEDYVSATLFTPLGMTSTSYFKTRLYDERGATLYLGLEPQKYWQILARPAGSINSSARDMANLVQFLLLRGSTPTTSILSPASIDRMEVSKTTLGASAGIMAGYGLANYTSGHKAFNVAFHGHNGGVMGGLSELAYVKETGEGYVVMISNGDAGALGQISDLIRDYLLRYTKPTYSASSDLPAKFREIDGYYLPINHRQQMMRYMGNLVAVMKISHDEKFLHRTPLFGSWVSSDRLASNGALIDGWHGLPAIAIVEDPLAGRAVQVGGELFQRTPAWMVFTRFIVIGLMIVMTLGGFIWFLVWCFKRFGKKRTSTDDRLWMRINPLLATAIIFAFQISLGLSGLYLQQAASISPLSVAVLLLSLAYPAVALFGVAQLFAPNVRQRKNLPYWFAAVFACVHLLIAGYLATYGVVGLRTWA